MAPRVVQVLLVLLSVSCRAPGPAAPAGHEPPNRDADRWPSTFSIVARDPATGDLGIAVQSKFFGVGSVVPWAEAGVGAVATQSYANTSYGPRGLELLRQGIRPEQVLDRLTSNDADREFRQIGIVDSEGRSASFTGKRNLPWAGSRSAEGFSVQGNLLVSEATLTAMARAFQESRGELAERLVKALAAGQAAGGDARGRQSAAVLVVRKNAGYGGFNDRYVDLRVDDHESPILELRRLVDLQLGKDPVSLAQRLEHQGQGEEAIRVLREGTEARPASSAARFELSRLLFAQGRGEEARKALEGAIAVDPEYDHAHFRAARLLAEVGLLEDSLKELKATLVKNAEYARVLERELESPSSPFQGLKDRLGALLRSP